MLIFALTFALFAADKCQTTLACKLADRAFTLEFRSPSGACAEDDGELRWLADGRATPLAIEKGWIDAIHDPGNATSLCAGDGPQHPSVYPAGGDRALVFYWRSGRPQLDYLGVALVDVARGRVLHAIDRLGELKADAHVVLKGKRGFRTRVVREHLKEVRCDCPAAAVEDWLEVYVEQNRIKTRWGR